MYLRAAKAELEAAGESTDGMANSVSTLRSSILALTDNQVDIMIDENTFKSTYQIMRELSQVWEDMADVDQAALLELIGGKRNSDAVMSLISNFEIAERALTTANNSAGSAMAENEKRIASIQGRITLFNQSFETFSAKFLDTDLVKFVVDLGTTVMRFLTDIVDKFGSLPPLITTIVGGLTAIKSIKGEDFGIFSTAVDAEGNTSIQILGKSLSEVTNKFNEAREAGTGFFGSIRAAFAGGVDLSAAQSSIQRYNDALSSSGTITREFITSVSGSDDIMRKYLGTLDGGAATLDGYKKAAKDAGVSLEGVGIGARAASIGVAALNIALNTLLTFGISLAINALITAISSAINAASELRQELMDTATEAKETADTVYDLVRSYEELGEALDAGVGSREDYLSTQSELITALGLEGKSVRELMGDYTNLRDAIIAAAQAELRSNFVDQVYGAEAAKEEAVADAYGPIDSANANKIGNYISGEFFKTVEEDREALKSLIEGGLEGIQGFDDSGLYRITLPVDMSFELGKEPSFEDLATVRDYFAQALDILEASGVDTQNSIYKNFSSGYEYYEDLISDAISYIDQANTTLLRSMLLTVEDAPDTQEEFDEFYNELVKKLSLSSEFDSGGTYTPETLVNSILGVDSRYSGFLEDMQQAQANAIAAANIRDNIIETLWLDTTGPHHNPFEAGTEEYKEWESEIGNLGWTLKSALEDLSLDELEYINDLIMSDGVKSWSNLADALKEYRSEEETAVRQADALRSKVTTLWNSEDFADSREELIGIVESLGGIDASQIEELAEEGSVLAEVLEEDGMNAQFLAHILEETAKGNNGFALITDDALKLNKALDGMVERFDEVSTAKARYDQAMSVEEKDEGFRSYAEAFEALNEQFVNGTTNSNAFWAAAEYLFGSGQLDAWGWSDGLDEIYQAMVRNKDVFGDADSAGAGFLDRLYEMSKAGELVNEQGERLLSITKDAAGGYDLKIDEGNIDAIASKMGLAEEAVLSCLKAISMWGDVDFYDITEVAAVMDEVGLSAEYAGSKVVDLASFEQQLRDLGKTGKEIYDIKRRLEELGSVEFLNTEGEISDLVTSLTNLGVAARTVSEDGTVNVSVDVSELGDLLSDLEFTEDRAKDVLKALWDLDGVTLTNANDEVIKLDTALWELGKHDFAQTESSTDDVGASAEQANENLTDIAQQDLGSINDQVFDLADSLSDAADNAEDAYDYLRKISSLDLSNLSSLGLSKGPSTAKKGVRYGIDGSTSQAYARGTGGAKPGPALTGEGGAELILSDGHAYLAGADGPEFVQMRGGETVYTAEETRAIFGRSGRKIVGKTPAYAVGVQGTGINTSSDKWQSVLPNTEDAVSGVTDAVNGLDDALQNMEETFDELIGDFEHTIYMMERHNASAEEIVAVYRQMQDAVHAQAEKYRQMGLFENDDHIQELQKQWWEYQDAIADAIADTFDKAVGEVENAVSIVENLLDHAYDDQDLKSIHAMTGNLLSYYRDMQDMVQEQMDRYRDMGYEDNSDEISELIDMWWEYENTVEEVKQNVVDHLIDMADAASSAVDDIQNVYNTLHDAADEYAANGGFISVDAYQSIVELGPQYMQYLRDENGLLKINEENINKVIAAKTRQLAVESAMNYVERLRLALQEGSVEDLNNLIFATTDATNATWGLVYANLALLDLSPEQYQAALHNINAIKALAENAVQSIGVTSGSYLEELENMKSGVDDILKYVMDMLRDRVERQIEALEDMKDAYAELIELKKESLEATKEESDYEDSVAEKVQEIADLQARINALSLDDSRDAQAQKIALEEQMAELQKELADDQAEHALDAQKNSLDEMQEAYEEQKDQEIAALEETISSEEKVYRAAISYIQEHWDTLYSELLQWNYEYGSIRPLYAVTCVANRINCWKSLRAA